MDNRRFAGRVAIVTGSSSGIGRATAELLASEGAKMVLCGRNVEKLDNVKSSLIALGATKSDVLVVVHDLSKDEAQKSLIDKTIARFGRIDILINNAGGFAEDNVGVEGLRQSLETFDYVMNLNVRAGLSLSKMARPYLKQTQGDIVNVSSVVGLKFAAKSYPYYSISKAALDQLTRSMAVEFIEDGIRVNSVNPGLTATDFFEKQGCTTESCREAENKFVDRPDMIPMRRVGTAMEIANAIAFLVDRKVSSYIIGHTLVIDGGASILMPMLSCSFHDFYKK